jgi:hypothetical protein
LLHCCDSGASFCPVKHQFNPAAHEIGAAIFNRHARRIYIDRFGQYQGIACGGLQMPRVAGPAGARAAVRLGCGAIGRALVQGRSPRHANRRLRLQALTRRDEEFVLSHCHNIQSSGFLEHIKLPHYVDFQAELELIRKLRCEAAQGLEAAQ